MEKLAAFCKGRLRICEGLCLAFSCESSEFLRYTFARIPLSLLPRAEHVEDEVDARRGGGEEEEADRVGAGQGELVLIQLVRRAHEAPARGGEGGAGGGERHGGGVC